MAAFNYSDVIRKEPKMLLRTSSFQKLCSLPGNLKFEGLKSSKEYFRTVIGLLKSITRQIIVTICYRMLAAILFHQQIWLRLLIVLKACFRSRNKVRKETTVGEPHSPILASQLAQLKCRTLQPGIYYKTWPTLFYSPQALIVYSCVLYTGVQLFYLLHMLYEAATVSFGLSFLITSLCYIGMILARIVVQEESRRCKKEC